MQNHSIEESAQSLLNDQSGAYTRSRGEPAGGEHVHVYNAELADALLERITPSPKPRSVTEVLLIHVQESRRLARESALAHHRALKVAADAAVDFEVANERVAAAVKALAALDPDTVPHDWAEIGPHAGAEVIPDSAIL